MAFLNRLNDGILFSAKGIIFQIFGPRWERDSVPQDTVRTLKVLKISSHGYLISGLVGKTNGMIWGDIP